MMDFSQHQQLSSLAKIKIAKSPPNTVNPLVPPRKRSKVSRACDEVSCSEIYVDHSEIY